MANAHETGQIRNALAILEDVTSHAVALALVSIELVLISVFPRIGPRCEAIHPTTSAAGGYAGSILSSVLQIVEGFVKVLGSDVLTRLIRPMAQDQADDSTHGALTI